MFGMRLLGGFSVAHQGRYLVAIEIELQELLVHGPLASARERNAAAPGFVGGRRVVEPAGDVAAKGPKGGVGGVLAKQALGPAHRQRGDALLAGILVEQLRHVGHLCPFGHAGVGPNGGRLAQGVLPSAGARRPAYKLPRKLGHRGKSLFGAAEGHVGFFVGPQIGKGLGIQHRRLGIAWCGRQVVGRGMEGRIAFK